MPTDNEVHALLAAANNPLLRWNTPLSEEHADLLVAACGFEPGGRALDLGCGWGELLMRLVASAPGSTGDGVDTSADALRRGERLAEERGLRERVRFHKLQATDWSETGYDLALCIGASHAWPEGTTGALKALREVVRPGGRALFGDGFWARPPSAAALQGLDAEPEDFGTLDDLVRAAVDAGFRPRHVTVADEREWDVFESNWCAGPQQWALDNPTHPLRDAVLAEVDTHRDGYLAGYRGTFGLAYLVLT